MLLFVVFHHNMFDILDISFSDSLITMQYFHFISDVCIGSKGFVDIHDTMPWHGNMMDIAW